jgi:hypothetical protein
LSCSDDFSSGTRQRGHDQLAQRVDDELPVFRVINTPKNDHERWAQSDQD